MRGLTRQRYFSHQAKLPWARSNLQPLGHKPTTVPQSQPLVVPYTNVGMDTSELGVDLYGVQTKWYWSRRIRQWGEWFIGPIDTYFFLMIRIFTYIKLIIYAQLVYWATFANFLLPKTWQAVKLTKFNNCLETCLVLNCDKLCSQM